MSDRGHSEFPPSVNVGRLYERTSSKGNVYLSGFFGTMKITALKSKDMDAEGNPIWNLMVSAAPSRDRAGNANGRFTAQPQESAKHAAGSGRRSAPPERVGTLDDEIPF